MRHRGALPLHTHELAQLLPQRTPVASEAGPNFRSTVLSALQTSQLVIAGAAAHSRPAVASLARAIADENGSVIINDYLFELVIFSPEPPVLAAGAFLHICNVFEIDPSAFDCEMTELAHDRASTATIQTTWLRAFDVTLAEAEDARASIKDFYTIFEDLRIKVPLQLKASILESKDKGGYSHAATPVNTNKARSLRTPGHATLATTPNTPSRAQGASMHGAITLGITSHGAPIPASTSQGAPTSAVTAHDARTPVDVPPASDAPEPSSPHPPSPREQSQPALSL